MTAQKQKSILNFTAVLNLAFLAGHQIDAAYWHEWEMFRLPGGIQFYNIFNIIFFIILIGCLVPTIESRKIGRYCSLAIALSSGLVLPIHSGFAIAGFTQFNLPVSIFLIVATFVISLFQIVLTFKHWHEFGYQSM